MSANVIVTVTHPTPSGDQLPIKHARIEARVDGASSWTQVATPILPTETTRTLADLAAGLWHVRAIWVDEGDAESVPAAGSIQVPNSPPSAGTIALAVE
jgi:hypothetical protein